MRWILIALLTALPLAHYGLDGPRPYTSAATQHAEDVYSIELIFGVDLEFDEVYMLYGMEISDDAKTCRVLFVPHFIERGVPIPLEENDDRQILIDELTFTTRQSLRDSINLDTCSLR